MKIESVRIQNFRSFQDVTVPFDDYTCLVGPNGAGKSTVLTALNVFFRESQHSVNDFNQLEPEDFHCRNTTQPAEITVTFCELSDDAIDDLSDYARHDKLVVRAAAIYDENSGKAPVSQYGERFVMKAFSSFFEAEKKGTSASELKQVYQSLQQTYKDLPNWSNKQATMQALREFEAARPEDCELVPSEDNFYGFSRGVNRLKKHIQWVFVPAVKDAASEQVEARNSALGKLLERTVRIKSNLGESITSLHKSAQQQYQALLDENQFALNDISASLQSRITEWAHPDVRLRLQWKQDLEKSVRIDEPWAHIIAGEGEFDGELSRFGHGLQRSYLLALLQELAGTDETGGPTLILACEEPELYQHPPQARHLAEVLRELSGGNAQVMVSTHNPQFVSGEGFPNVRMIRKDSSQQASTVSHMSFDDISRAIVAATGETLVPPSGTLAKIHQALQPSLNEMFFTSRLVLVEGLEDIAYLTTYINLMDKVSEFRRLGIHLVATNGKSQLVQPLCIARHMKLPTYVVFDADGHDTTKSSNKSKHEKDNTAILKILDQDSTNLFPASTLLGPGFTMWQNDVGKVVEEDLGKDNWVGYQNKADNLYGHAGGLKKYALHIGASLTFAWEDGKQSNSLIEVCNRLLESSNYR